MASSNEHIPSSIYLVDYFIYCPLFCEKEGQEARKILYYYPSDTEIDRQIRTVGYCEGLVQFTETFAFDDPCESIHFQKSRLLFYQVENDICLAMLQYGTMSTLIHQSSVDELRYILKFIQYHIHNMIRDVTIDSSYFGIQYLAIDRRIFLKFQTILRRFQLHFTSLKEMIFIYRDQLISSGLNQDDTITIYSFFRLYYWPHIKNLSHISTIRSNRELTSPANHLTNTLAEDVQWFHPTGKIMVKRENDPWIIAKRSDMRELLVIVNQKSANLKEISGKISFIE
ncbi:unnamed protein product [Adineta steineri]|uniref:CCZ1/INTU/HSP4 first Longin domain-containing protein n=1 Tax=Adineta steineri TaxID=433720 RepID=A0A818GM55_9BILA|nr:unnamed protein product [Adineta steineri]CAF3491051.1 unnamed protein product [Adineta steineri]